MPLFSLMLYYHGVHSHPSHGAGAIALVNALEWLILLPSPTIRDCWVPVCCSQENFHHLYCHQHTDINAQRHSKGLSRHTPVVVHYHNVARVCIEWSLDCRLAFLSHHINKEGLCENHFQAIVIPEPMLFRRHQNVPRFPFNNSQTEVKLVAEIKISFDQQYIPLILHLDVPSNLLKFHLYSSASLCERIPWLEYHLCHNCVEFCDLIARLCSLPVAKMKTRYRGWFLLSTIYPVSNVTLKGNQNINHPILNTNNYLPDHL